MKSLTKFRITSGKIRDIFVAAGIGEADEIEELSDGWYNSVFSVVCGGKKYVIKIAPEKRVRVLTHERNLMAAEVNFYKLMNQKTAIITPKIIFCDFSEKIIPTAYFIMEFLYGTRLDKAELTAEERESVRVEWARTMAELHKIRGEGYGYGQAGLSDSWKDALTHMTQILIDDAAAFGKKCRIGKKLLAYIERFSYALKDVPCVLVNFDLHGMNLFCQRTADGGIRLAVLDVERSFWGDPLGDFITADSESLAKPLARKKILTYYNKFAQSPVTVGKNEQIRYHLLTAYLAVIMYTERFSRFKGLSKYFNPVYLFGTLAGRLIGARAFYFMKKIKNSAPRNE